MEQLQLMRETGKSKTCVWSWQERFAARGLEGLLCDKTRPSRFAKLDPSVAKQVIALTTEEPPGETTPRTGAATTKALGEAFPQCSASGSLTGSSRTGSGVRKQAPKVPVTETMGEPRSQLSGKAQGAHIHFVAISIRHAPRRTVLPMAQQVPPPNQWTCPRGTMCTGSGCLRPGSRPE